MLLAFRPVSGCQKSAVSYSLILPFPSPISNIATTMCKLLAAFSLFAALVTSAAKSNQTFDTACYDYPLPELPPANDTRVIPWGSPGVRLANGTTCCESIEEVRAQIGEVDIQILKLLGKR